MKNILNAILVIFRVMDSLKLYITEIDLMIDKNISSQVLTIGVDYKEPKGGIAFVLNAYSKFYKPFNFVCTSIGSSKIFKLFILLKALVVFLYFILFRNISIVHIHGASYNSYYRKRIFINLALFFNKKVVYHIHGGEFHLFVKNNPKVIATLKKCHKVIVLSEYWKDYFENSLGIKSVTIIHNICHHPKIIGVRDDSVIKLLFLGEIGERKGIFDLVQAIAMLPKSIANKIHLDAGGGGEIERLKKLISDNNLSSRVTYHGWISGDQKAELLSKANVYALPSYNEGLPISILEAMSYKLPILSTSVGGIPEVIKNGGNGFLIEPGNITQIKNILESLAEGKLDLSAMGEKSYALVQPYLPEQVEHSLGSLYKNLLGEK